MAKYEERASGSFDSEAENIEVYDLWPSRHDAEIDYKWKGLGGGVSRPRERGVVWGGAATEETGENNKG